MVKSRSSMEPRVCINDNMIIQCEGAWTIPNLAALDHTLQTIQWPDMSKLMWDTMNISAIDTGGAVLLHRTLMKLRKEGHRVSVQGLRAEFGELLQMVSSKYSRIDELDSSQSGYLSQLEQWRNQKIRQAAGALEFVGEATVHVIRSLQRPSLGKGLYQRLCSACRGKAGTGDGYVLFNPPAAELKAPATQEKTKEE